MKIIILRDRKNGGLIHISVPRSLNNNKILDAYNKWHIEQGRSNKCDPDPYYELYSVILIW